MNPDGLRKVTYWMEQGITLAQLAVRMEISRQTLFNWKHRFPEFSQAIDEGIDNEHNGEVVRLRHCKQCGKPFIRLSCTIDAYGFHVAGEEFCSIQCTDEYYGYTPGKVQHGVGKRGKEHEKI